jgi:hypothetical protein
MLQDSTDHRINRFNSGCTIIEGLRQRSVVLPKIGCSLSSPEVQIDACAHVLSPADHLPQETFQRIQRNVIRIPQRACCTISCGDNSPALSAGVSTE